MNAKKVTTFRERFSELVASCGKSQSSIASEFGVAKQTISAWITGQSSPRSPVLSALSDYFGVSLAWLMGYDVHKYEDKEKSSEFDRFIYKQIYLTDDERLLLDLYRNADERAKEDAIHTLRIHQREDTREKAE